MKKQIHRNLKWGRGLMNGIDQSADLPYIDPEAYFNIQNTQRSEAFYLNDLAQTSAEDGRTGKTVFANEIRVKLILRNLDASVVKTFQNVNYSSQMLGIQNDNWKTVRNYQFKLNEAAVKLGGATFAGSVDGFNELAEATAIVANMGSQTISGTEGNPIIDDTHPHIPPAYSISTGIPDLDQLDQNWIQTQVVPAQLRILILKWWDIDIPVDFPGASNIFEYFLHESDELDNEKDFYGPTHIQIIGEDEYRTTYCVNDLPVGTIRLTAPIAEKHYKKVDILFDKIVTFTYPISTFTMDEVWKLNEIVEWTDDDHRPIKNGIVMMIYTQPTSYRLYATPTYRGYRTAPMIFHYDLCSEFYYTQPN
jgi:hypothetical protein